MSDLVQMTDERGRFRAREVEVLTGTFDQLFGRIPEFELGDFRIGDAGPNNPYYKTVIRKPLSPAEVPMPVGVVSTSYTLVQHREIALLCKEALEEEQVSLHGLKCELGMTPLGEYMVFRIYLPDRSAFTAKDGTRTSLRLECVNSVDGSHRLMIFFGWLRLVCLNGLMVRDSMMDVKELHDSRLDLDKAFEAVRIGLGKAAKDVNLFQQWESDPVDLDLFGSWVDTKLADSWGKRAASRVYFIATQGRDIEWIDPFESARPSARRVNLLETVPGSKAVSETLYDILQALTYVATQRPNVDERLAWQSQVPSLMADLRKQAMREQP